MKTLFKSVILSLALLSGSAYSQDRLDLVMPGAPGSFGFTIAELIKPALQDSGFVVNYVAKPGAGGKIAVTYLRDRALSNEVLVAGSGIVKFETVISPDFKSVLDDYQFVGPVLAADFVAVTARNIDLATIFKDTTQYTVSAANPAAQTIINQVNARYPGKFLAVPYKDSNQSWLDMRGGHIDIDLTRVPFARGRNDTGVKILGITAPSTDQTPSLSKFVPGLNVRDNAIGLLMRRDADLDLVARVDNTLSAFYSSTLVRARLSVEGYRVIANAKGAHNQVLIQEIARLKK